MHSLLSDNLPWIIWIPLPIMVLSTSNTVLEILMVLFWTQLLVLPSLTLDQTFVLCTRNDYNNWNSFFIIEVQSIMSSIIASPRWIDWLLLVSVNTHTRWSTRYTLRILKFWLRCRMWDIISRVWVSSSFNRSKGKYVRRTSKISQFDAWGTAPAILLRSDPHIFY